MLTLAQVRAHTLHTAFVNSLVRVRVRSPPHTVSGSADGALVLWRDSTAGMRIATHISPLFLSLFLSLANPLLGCVA